MKVSLITPTYNSEETLDETIDSVVSQNYSNIEYIVVDGGSTDRTHEILNHYRSYISHLLIEPDRGVYDAMNKGIKRATGDIVGIINSDDIYSSIDVISEVVGCFVDNSVDVVYSNIQMVSRSDSMKVVRLWRPGEFQIGSFSSGWHPPHPGLFLKASVYDSCGLYDINYDVSSDFELMLRVFEVYGFASYYLDKCVVNMRIGGQSTKSIGNIINGNVNIFKAFKKNNVRYPYYYPLRRFLDKVNQFC